MARMTVTNETPGFFAADAKVWLSAGLGAVFGVLAAYMGRWIHNFTCGRLAITSCLPDAIGTYRIGLVLLAVVMLLVMVLARIERPLFIILPSVIVLWSLFLALTGWQRLLAYAGLGFLLFGLFGWLSRVYQWWLAVALAAVVTIILVLI